MRVKSPLSSCVLVVSLWLSLLLCSSWRENDDDRIGIVDRNSRIVIVEKKKRHQEIKHKNAPRLTRDRSLRWSLLSFLSLRSTTSIRLTRLTPGRMRPDQTHKTYPWHGGGQPGYGISLSLIFPAWLSHLIFLSPLGFLKVSLPCFYLHSVFRVSFWQE